MNMITVELNGEAKTVASNQNLEQAIVQWDLASQQFAIAVNENFVPQSLYANTLLQEGDRVELLVPMQGG